MLENLRGKKIAIVGLGKNNQKLADYLTSKEINYDVIDDWSNPDELIGRLDEYQIIFRTPGLPFLSNAVAEAKSKGVEISSQTKLFFKLCPANIIGVTGTKGKGTTSSLLAQILETSGQKTWLAGNIGRDPFEFLDQIQPPDLVILELSSFQLQDLDQSPHIAVVLNITSDHLNHHQSVEEYISAKSSILKFQTNQDYAILHKSLPESFKNLGRAQKIFFDAKDASRFETKLLGEHNLENIAAAAVVAKLIGVDESAIRKVVLEFEPLDHRLKVIKQIRGITYIDDGYSTNIESAIAAIKAISSPLILIVGGFDKGLDFSPLIEKINQSRNIKGLIVIGQVTSKIAPKLPGQVLTGAGKMQEILAQAQSLASSGDTILFSPATSSFDLFKNETDRGEQFVNAVNQL